LRHRRIEPRAIDGRAPPPRRRRSLRGEAGREEPLRHRRHGRGLVRESVWRGSDTPRVRRYALAVQLVLLLCCGVASGYLWRAALGSGRAFVTRFVYAGRPYEPSWFSVRPTARVPLTRARVQKQVTRHTGRPRSA